MSRLVVDASVAVKWYLDEPHAEAARRLLGGAFRPIVPGFFFAEVGNVLWKRWRRGELTAEDILVTLAGSTAEVKRIEGLALVCLNRSKDGSCLPAAVGSTTADKALRRSRVRRDACASVLARRGQALVPGRRNFRRRVCGRGIRSPGRARG